MRDRSRQCSVLPSADSQEGPGPHVPSGQVTVLAYGGGRSLPEVGQGMLSAFCTTWPVGSAVWLIFYGQRMRTWGLALSQVNEGHVRLCHGAGASCCSSFLEQEGGGLTCWYLRGSGQVQYCHPEETLATAVLTSGLSGSTRSRGRAAAF